MNCYRINFLIKNLPTYIVNRFLISLLAALLFQSSFGQLIVNTEGEFNLESDYFNPDEVKTRKIKSVTVTYSDKKSLQPIKKRQGVSQNYLFDKDGRIIRYYSTKLMTYGSVDTAVEWRFYKGDKLETVKKTAIEDIKVKTIFYEEGFPTVEIFGKSESGSSIKTKLNIVSYKEQYAQYISYMILKKGDSVVNRKALGGKVVERLTYSYPDSTSKKIKIEYPYSPFMNTTRVITYENKLVARLTVQNPNEDTYEYVYGYDSEQKIAYFTKNNLSKNSTESFSELIYDEDTQNLQAIITKNYYTEEISISKYKYTYYP